MSTMFALMHGINEMFNMMFALPAGVTAALLRNLVIKCVIFVSSERTHLFHCYQWRF